MTPANLSFLAAMLTLPLVLSLDLHALDVVKLPKPQSTKDIRFIHKNEVLRAALELTKEEFGPYEIHFNAPIMKRSRALEAMKSGDLINVYFSPPKKLWAENTIVIDVPIRRGVLSYRLLLVHKNDLELFSKINTANDLKKLKAGLQHGWSTTDALDKSGFDYVKAYNFDGLFYMLESHRFNYLPRGVHEVFDELDARRDELKNVVIEPSLALYLPAPTYTYVSPREPRLAQRIEMGMKMMVNNGLMKDIFDKYYLDDLKKAKLHERKIIDVGSDLEDNSKILEMKELWFDFDEGR